MNEIDTVEWPNNKHLPLKYRIQLKIGAKKCVIGELIGNSLLYDRNLKYVDPRVEKLEQEIAELEMKWLLIK